MLCVIACLVLYPDWSRKNDALEGDRTVSLVLDWIDLPSNVSDLPIQGVAVPDSILPARARRYREAGFFLLWRGKIKGTSLLLDRIRPADGLLGYGNKAYGYPFFLSEVAETIRDKAGFLPRVEFGRQRGENLLARAVWPRIIKAHMIQKNEMLTDKRALWLPRLLRAADERWVRLFYLHTSPALSPADNVRFLKNVAESFQRKGYQLGRPSGFPVWQTDIRLSSRTRNALMLLIALAAPFIVLLWWRRSAGTAPFLVFMGSAAVSVLAGTAVYFMGSTPLMSSGLEAVRGVKIQLLIPFLAGWGLLLTRNEWKSFLQTRLTVAHVGIVGIGFLIVVFIYLMRSGNFPLIPVSDVERHFRNAMEGFFGVRPRLKEFMIGHPLLMAGLTLMRRENSKKNFWRDGRLFLWGGLIGQISIVNTFFHLHTPLLVGYLRTMHGLWLGFLISLPVCWALDSFNR